MAQADIGLIGLAVMGQNLVLNMSDHDFRVAVYNRSPATTEAFAQGAAQLLAVEGNLLAELDGRGTVIDSEDLERHSQDFGCVETAQLSAIEPVYTRRRPYRDAIRCGIVPSSTLLAPP